MKKALILHGTDGSSLENWFPWLKQQLENKGYEVWCPNLPGADRPSIEKYNKFILKSLPFEIDKETILIGHSSGAVAILGLLDSMPEDTFVQACYLVGSFKDDLGWNILKDLFVRPFNFSGIKLKSRLWYFIHSDNDPYCPLEHAQYLHSQLGGDLIVLPGQKHFSIETAGEDYRKFPYLYHLIAEDAMTAEDVVSFYDEMERKGVKLWLDGGWGVDALLGKQTRQHGDIDIAILKKNVKVATNYLKSKGYAQIHRSDTSPHNFMLGNNLAQFVDFHVIQLDEDGNGLYGSHKEGVMYPADALSGKGNIGNKDVWCISPQWVVNFHSGYQLRGKDYTDVLAICKKFDIKIPAEYEKNSPHIRFNKES